MTSTNKRSFWTQAYWVATSYWRRTALLSILAGAVFCWAIAVYWYNVGTSDWRVAIQPRPMHSFVFSNFATIGEEQTFREVELSKLRSLRYDGRPDERLPARLGDMPNLQALHLGTVGSNATREAPNMPPELAANYPMIEPEDLDVLATKSLNYLSIQNCGLAPGVLEEFGKRFPIQTLIIDDESLKGHISELESFQQVRHLEIHTDVMTPQLVEMAMELPQLEILTIDSSKAGRAVWFNNGSGNRLVVSPSENSTATASELSRLKTHPGLKWLFLGTKGQETVSPELQREMLPLRVLPVHQSRRQLVCLHASMFATAFVSAVVMIQLWSQFLLPGSQLQPRFAGPHLLVGGVLLASGLVVSLAVIPFNSMSAIPLLTVLLVCPAVVALLTATLKGKNAQFQQMVGILFGVSFSLNGALIQILSGVIPAQMAWYLEGHWQLAAVGVLVLELILLVLASRRMAVMYRVFAESSLQLPVNFLTGPQQMRQLAYQPQPVQWKIFDVAPKNLAWHGGNSTCRASLWRQAVPMPLRQIALIFVAVVFLIVAGTWIINTQFSENHTTNYPMLTSALFLMGGSAVPIVVVGSWMQRIQSLSWEITHPVGRKAFVRELMSAYVQCQLPCVVGVVAVAIFGVATGQSWLAILSLTLFVGGGLFLAMCCGLLLFAIRFGLLAQILSFAPAIIVLHANLLIFVIVNSLRVVHGETTLFVLSGVGAGMLLAGVLVGLIAYQRALSREWGMA
ncbi:MAG: hypothetical protein H6824_11280 [Planctomycetaceae bacterium]|nr:hypothetical protein [Planctomycetaceae bacterium]